MSQAAQSNKGRKRPPGYWLLKDAKARFSELVRKAHSEGPQHVTVHGRDEVVVIAVDEYRAMQGQRSGQDLIDLMRTSPLRDVEISAARGAMPVRDVVL